MDKKMYFEPEMEVILLQMESTLLADSLTDPDEDSGEAPKDDTEI